MRLITSLLLLGLSSSALAQEPPELTWAELLERPLIVRATVVEGGRWVATVRVDHVVQGKAPDGPLTVTGFNSPGFPTEAVEGETFRRGQAYWLFLEPFQGVRHAGEIPIDVSALPAGTWRVPAAVAGDLPIVGEGVKLRALRPSYPVFGSVMPSDRFELFVELGLARARGEQPTTEQLRPLYECVKGAEVLPPNQPLVESSQAQCAALLAHLGATEWSEDLERLGASSSDVTRAAVGMASSGMRGDPALRSTVRAVLDPADMTHGYSIEAMRSITSADRRRELSNVLASILAASRTGEVPSWLPADRARSDQGRIKVARVLVQLGEPSAASVLVDELPFCNPEVLSAYVEALDALGSRGFEGPLVALLSLRDGRFMASLEALKRFDVTSARPALHTLLADPTLSEERIRKVLWALETLGDDETVDLVRDRLTARIQTTIVWDDTQRDLAAAELSVLRDLQKSRSMDLAFELARSYLGLPKQVVAPAWRTAYEAELQRIHGVATSAAGPGSSVGLLWIAARPGELGVGDPEVALYLDVRAEPMVSGLQGRVAEAVHIDPERVRVCGPGAGGWRCEQGDQAPWVRHQVMVNTILDVVLLGAGYGVGADVVPSDEAVAWLHVLDQTGITDQVGSDWKLRDLDRSMVPEHFLPVAPPLFAPERRR